MPRCCTLLCGLVLSAALSSSAAAQDIAWRTGRALEQQLGQPMSVRWQQMPLREALNSLAASQQVAIVLDRRVDPGQPLDLELRDVPVASALARIAADRGLGVAQLDAVMYVGPPSAARRIRTLAALAREQVEALPRAARERLLARQSWQWEDFATPRVLLEHLADSQELTVENLDAVPHDLWPRASLPPLTLVDRLTLVLIGFDLTFEVADQGRAIRIVPARADMTLTRSYPAGRDPQATASRVASLVPDAAVRVQGEQIEVRGRAEDHARVAALLSGQPQRRARHTVPRERVKVFTLNVENKPLGPLVRQLAAQLQLELQMDDSALAASGVELQRLVSLQVNSATLEELLNALLLPHQLGYRLSGQQLEVFPAP